MLPVCLLLCHLYVTFYATYMYVTTTGQNAWGDFAAQSPFIVKSWNLGQWPERVFIYDCSIITTQWISGDKILFTDHDVHFITVAIMRLTGYWDLKILLPLSEIWPVFYLPEIRISWVDSSLQMHQINYAQTLYLGQNNPRYKCCFPFHFQKVLVSIHTIFSYLTQYIYFISINSHSVHSFHQGN